MTEFIIGNDVEGALVKLQAFISSYSKETFSQFDGVDLKYMSWPIENVYSEQSLDAYLSLDTFVILKLFRNNCKQCIKFEPIFYEYAKDSSMRHFRWVQADVDNVPTYVTNLKARLSGKANTGEAGKYCETCSSTGFISCISCKNSGVVARGELTLICPDCLGLLILDNVLRYSQVISPSHTHSLILFVFHTISISLYLSPNIHTLTLAHSPNMCNN